MYDNLAVKGLGVKRVFLLSVTYESAHWPMTNNCCIEKSGVEVAWQVLMGFPGHSIGSHDVIPT